VKQLFGLLIFALGSLILLEIFLQRRLKASKAVTWVVRNSPYNKLLPYILAQAKHESNNFSSPLYYRAKNMFGMKNASIRKQLGFQVALDPYRQYKNDSESVEDFIDWLNYNNFPLEVKSLSEYVEILKSKKYFEDDFTNYLNNLKKWL
jgi:flagellum-specific peptidoglycan hydrolase FlgJ